MRGVEFSVEFSVEFTVKPVNFQRGERGGGGGAKRVGSRHRRRIYTEEKSKASLTCLGDRIYSIPCCNKNQSINQSILG